MRALIGCEFSGRVRQQFRLRGIDAWSCDIVPCEDESEFHIQDDIRNVLTLNWDMLIAFPPCTHLATSGARWFAEKQEQQAEAVEFVKTLLSCGIDRIAIENPVGILSTQLRKPDQIIQPWEFGHPHIKATCLWLNNLPRLTPTKILPRIYVKNGVLVDGRQPIVHHMVPSTTRAADRSRTYKGIAKAMAQQWSE